MSTSRIDKTSGTLQISGAKQKRKMEKKKERFDNHGFTKTRDKQKKKNTKKPFKLIL